MKYKCALIGMFVLIVLSLVPHSIAQQPSNVSSTIPVSDQTMSTGYGTYIVIGIIVVVIAVTWIIVMLRIIKSRHKKSKKK